MFRKLFALEVAAISSYETQDNRTDAGENEFLINFREIFAPRTGSYGSMWSGRSAG